MIAKQKKLLEMIEELDGDIAAALRDCDVSKATHYQWLGEFKDYRAAIQVFDDYVIDLAESVMVKHLKANSLQAAKFVLERRGRKKGWHKESELQSITQVNNVIIVPQVAAQDGAEYDGWSQYAMSSQKALKQSATIIDADDILGDSAYEPTKIHRG